MMMNDDTRELDPELIQVLQTLRHAGAPELYRLRPPEARRAYQKAVQMLSAPPPANALAHRDAIETDWGELDVVVYTPRGAGDGGLPMLVYFHGGGWSFGGIASHDAVCRTFCAKGACIVASVDYRLAPEHKFPDAVDDAIASTTWAAKEAARFGADPCRIAVGGDSAGATLAAVAALAARDNCSPDLRCQLLIYPATDMSMSLASHSQMGIGYRLTRPLMVWSALNYLRDGRDILDPRASPLYASDHSNLPYTIIVTAGFDPLRDEGAAYAQKLIDARVTVDYHCFDSLIHGFISLTGVVEAAAQALDRIASMLHRRLAS